MKCNNSGYKTYNNSLRNKLNVRHKFIKIAKFPCKLILFTFGSMKYQTPQQAPLLVNQCPMLSLYDAFDVFNLKITNSY